MMQKMKGVLVLGFSVLLATFTRSSASPATIITAIASAVGAGTGIVGTTLSTLMNNGYSVNCGIEVENWTRFPLTYPTVKIDGGVLSNPPNPILPAGTEIMVTHKTANTATGSYGTVSWLVEGLNRRVVIMWDAPYDFNFYSNYLGVGITQEGYVDHNDNWYHQMYNDNKATSLNFTRKAYRYKFAPVIFSDDRIEVVGTMGSSHQAQVMITVRARYDKDLAGPIRRLLNSSMEIN